MAYVVAIFTATNEVEVIPSNWVFAKDKGYWPPFKTTDRITKAVKERIPPETTWPSYKINIHRACGKFCTVLIYVYMSFSF